ncbi:prolyl oligopeptidase family serine peptidase [Allosphingosinicella indica]|uniref:Prolyl oligopeptidase n=1 Tax=Allosphingosinicella indica TaxID=941907 RepID=A0A1X7H141_9SPHN|nr:prolyl oligopeptidase family serine peptidase [Allosphingosinicella indica]SMF77616.1 prolyl oligopeptidase [Allosphingosinicella indica]
MHRPALALAAILALAAAAPAASSDDPYLWLEEIEGAKALDQVKTWNAATEALLTKSPGYEQDRTRARAILDDEQQIALPEDVIGANVTNIWRDAKNPRGLWRVASLDSYAAGKPQWRTLIDVDALGKAEGKSWVWHGANCLAPEYVRCLVSLSPGGTDADVVREFDVSTGKFVEGGFMLPEAKSSAAWVDKNTLLIATDWGEGSLTASGYPRIAKLWKRGTPITTATTVKEGEASDVSLQAFSQRDGGRIWPILNRGKTFYTDEMFVGTANGKFVPVPVPDTASYQDVIGGRLIYKLNRDWDALKAGSIVAIPLADVAAGRAVTPELVMAPSKSQAIEEVSSSDSILWVKALDDVSGKLFALRRGGDGRWAATAVPLAGNSTVQIAGVAGERNMAFATVEGMLTPPTLYAVGADGKAAAVQSLPAKFDAAAMEVEQRFATSKDGTRVPYFLVRKKGVKGPVPALIHAYGGFRAAQTPTYLTGQPYRSGPLGMVWVEDGNAYVLANIRGGGEYGPAWHEAALREKRQNSFDDLHAVAEDLVKTGVSAKGKIAISGRSNGGVLVGAALVQRPDLYGAVISGSPLHDMKRYTKLLAGASWAAEYGDPDKPEDWAFMSKYSPYQNVKKGVKYPPVFFYLSTKDDRVHPGHARKMAARLGDYGNAVYYHEYLEGGHSVGADHAEDAVRAALLHAFLQRELSGEGK